MNNMTCYTIGHSKHTLQRFADLLKPYNINLVIDVRSIPYSRHASQFNYKTIKQSFSQFNLEYEYMGDELGGKFNNPDLLDEKGKLDYEKVVKSENFQKGLDKVIIKIKDGIKIAIMCAEKDPFNCHRFMLISRELKCRGVQVIHLLADGTEILNESENNYLQIDLI